MNLLIVVAWWSFFPAEDGSIIYEQTFMDLGTTICIIYDEIDDCLYVTGTTTYFYEMGNRKPTRKENEYYNHGVCVW